MRSFTVHGYSLIFIEGLFFSNIAKILSRVFYNIGVVKINEAFNSALVKSNKSRHLSSVALT